MKKFFTEFREFLTRGNVVDLAVGIIIGSAFSSLVKSVVDNLLMPPLGLLFGSVDFQDKFIILKQGTQSLPSQATLQMAKDVGAVTLNYGQFITDLISFILLGFGVFLIIKAVKVVEAQKEEAKEKSEKAPTEKACPYCAKEIPISASRCPYCTSQLPGTQVIENE